MIKNLHNVVPIISKQKKEIKQKTICKKEKVFDVHNTRPLYDQRQIEVV